MTDEAEIKALFTLGAQDLIKNLEMREDRINCSVKYGIIGEETALVGMVKQKNESTGEIKNVGTLSFARTTVKAPVEEDSGAQPGKMRVKMPITRGGKDSDAIIAVFKDNFELFEGYLKTLNEEEKDALREELE